MKAYHPRREAIGKALARMIPMPDDKQAERKLIRRLEIGKALR